MKNELDNGGFGYLIRGKKQLDTQMVPLYGFDPEGQRAYEVSKIPIDSGVTKFYYSRAGGFVPANIALDTSLSQAIHYGEAFFEGMRFYDSPNGVVLSRPACNFARFQHSASLFNPVLARLIVESFSAEHDLQSIELGMAPFPKQFYDLAEKRYQEGQEMSIPITKRYPNGHSEQMELPLTMKVAGGFGLPMNLTMKRLDAITKMLAFLGRLVSADYFPQDLEMMNAGYIRLYGVVAGAQGLKVPSCFSEQEASGARKIKSKDMHFGAITLPWALYLSEEDYKRGLDVLASPYRRIHDDTMPSNMKVSGNYVNSMMAINMGNFFGYGEILAFNSKGKFVEGSAENAFVIMDECGQLVAYTPPIGDGCLPGTTRDGVIRAIEGLGIDLRYKSLGFSELTEAKAIILTGTGAQMIHVRSINTKAVAEEIAKIIRLRSEGSEAGAAILWEDFKEEKHLINNGDKHPIVDTIQAAFKQMLLEGERYLEPAYNIDLATMAELVGVDIKDVTTKGDRENAAAGYFKDRINGIEAPDELLSRYKKMARIIRTTMKKADLPGIPLGNLLIGKNKKP